MIDITLVILTVLAALGYRFIVNKGERGGERAYDDGVSDYSRMPEMRNVAPLEACEFNASKFLPVPGSGKIVGVFGVDA